jgi:glucokinase
MPKFARSQSPEPPAVIALDIGGTKLASGLFTDSGAPSDKRAVPLDGRRGAAVGELIAREVRRLQKAAVRRRQQVRAIGVSVPGIVNSRGSSVWAPNIPGWEDFPLRDVIRRSLDAAAVKNDIKIVVDNDRAASILGEAWQGVAQRCRNAVFLAVGTGIGAGILLDGHVVRGAHGIAGAIGWLALDRHFDPAYVACGCFESHASGEGIARVGRSLVASHNRYRGALAKGAALTSRDIFAAHEAGDSLAQLTIDEAVEFWGLASANLISLLNPEKLIFGGGVFGPAAPLIGAIAAQARRWAQPISFEQVEFYASLLEDEAARYGAGFLAGKAAGLLRSPTKKRQ